MLDRLIYGGSFDPPHRGHAAMARYVLETGVTRALDVVPAAVSPYKTAAPPAAPEFRMAMLKETLESDFARAGSAAADYRERTRILELELHRPPPSYTADTCRELRKAHPNERIGLLMGSDGFPGLDGWNRVDEILEHHEVVIFRRSDAENLETGMARFPGATFRLLDNPLVDCSSTELRESIARAWAARGKPEVEGDCLAAEVLELINRHELYRRNN